MLTACAPVSEESAATPDRKPARARPAAASGVFNPAEHRADDVRAEVDQIIRNIAPLKEAREETTETFQEAASDTAGARLSGYRVQVFASTTRAQAEWAAGRARRRFPDDTVYIVFQAPWHKVRIGDYRTQRDAEEKLKEARSKGYREPFWVPPAR